MMSVHEEEFCALVSTLRDVIKVAYYLGTFARSFYKQTLNF